MIRCEEKRFFLEKGLKKKKERMSKQEDSPATLNITNKEGNRKKKPLLKEHYILYVYEFEYLQY